MKKLRRKIVFGVFLSAAAVFLAAIIVIGATVLARNIRKADEVTELIAAYNGKLPGIKEYEKLSPQDRIFLYQYDEESPYRLRYFVVNYSEDSTVSCDLEHIAAINGDTAVAMADTALSSAKKTGFMDDFRYRVDDKRESVIFLDCSDELDTSSILMLFMIILAATFVLMITVVFHFLSKRIVRPFEENARMQKQFITDASHELKTPLAIISANAEVLAYKVGDNEWINNITTQVERIGGLINELLTLNRLDEIETNVDLRPVDLSELIGNSAAVFEQVFSGKNVTVSYDIQPGVVINGNPDQLARLISVLTENASKYVSENGEVSVGLKNGLKYVELNIFNTCPIDPEVDYSNLFERFYRPDSSRTSKTGGHGVGLSIAARITELHNGSIEAVPSENGLTFKVRLSNKLKAGKSTNNQ